MEILDHATVAENAACLWEAALDVNRVYGAQGSPARETAPDWARAMLERWEYGGACEMRSDICKFAGAVERAFTVAQESGFGSPFDWEFCPWFISNCLDWSGEVRAVRLHGTIWTAPGLSGKPTRIRAGPRLTQPTPRGDF